MSALDPNMMFHLQRSHCIDAFARAEIAITSILRRHMALKGTELLGCNIVKLREIPAGPQYSKVARNIVQAALDQLEPLILVRNDLVHGELTMLSGEGHKYATFANPRLHTEVGSLARLMTSDDFEQFFSLIRAVSAKLEAAANMRHPMSATDEEQPKPVAQAQVQTKKTTHPAPTPKTKTP